MTLFDSVKDFVRSVTTSDHYAAYDRRDSQHAPLKSSYPMHAPSADSDSQYFAGSRNAALNSSRRGNSASSSTTDIALGAYPDGQEAPSAAVAWERIDRWLESNYPELEEMIHDGSTENDLDELEHDLDCVLPRDVREHFLTHDGQDSTGRPTGLVYGMEMLDLESVVEEWSIWRNTALKLNQMAKAAATAEAAAAASSSSGPSSSENHSQNAEAAAAASHAAATLSAAGAGGSAAKTRRWLDNQRSVPQGAVQTVYAHPGWIPLVKDGEGNNIAVDLAPGKQGSWGQVILFGRNFDTKYVIAPNWGSFLVQFADDLQNGNWFVDDDIEEPVFAFKSARGGPLVSYLTVLRGRSQRQYGFANAQNTQNQQQQQQSQRPAPPLITTSQTDLTTKPETVIKLQPPEIEQKEAPKEAVAQDEPKTQNEPVKTVEEPKKEVKVEAETEPAAEVLELGDDLQNVDLALDNK